MEEIWKDIPEYENLYQVSSYGRIKSLDHYTKDVNKTQFIKGRILKPQHQTTGYYKVTLSKNGIKKQYTIHRLVAKTFLANPENKIEVNHIDGDKLNNNISNLEWTTPKENTRHAIKSGLNKNYGENHYKSILTKKDVLRILELLKQGLSHSSIAKQYNVSRTLITRINVGTAWKHLTN